MAKFYAFSFPFKKYSLLLIGTFSFLLSFGQTDISIGTGTAGNGGTTYPTPLPDWHEGTKMQHLYRASELIAVGMGPGNINAIKYNVTNLNTFTGNIQQYTVKIGGSSVTTLTNTSWENVPNIVYGPIDYVPTLGINTLTFSTPYFWNGTDNIVIEICNGLPTNTGDGITHYTNNVTVPWTTGLSFNGSHSRVQDNGGNLCNTATTTNTGTQTSRPNITFSWVPAAACNAAPNAGTASASPTTVCLNQSISLSTAGVTVASGLAYQWQSSTDNGTTWSNITGATSLSASATQMITSLYRLRVICTNTNDTSYSNNVQVTSPPVPGGIYTISKDTVTNWPIGRNFNSFNDAYNAIKCGISTAVVFNVISNATPYSEQVIINGPIPNASATNTITFKGNGAIIGFSSSNSNERAVFKLKGAKYFIFDSLVVNADAGTYGYGFHFLNNADFNTVRACTINTSTISTAQNYAGIVINGSDAGLTSTGTVLSDGNEFNNNVIKGGYYGVVIAATFNGGSNGNNKISNNDISEFYSSGVYVAGSYGTTIEANTFSRPTRTAVTDFNGIYFTAEKSIGANITRNRIKNPFGGALTSTAAFNGINFNGADGSVGGENLVTNNLIYNVNGAGPQTGISNTGSDYVYYLHNTIALDNATSSSTNITRGFFQTTTASGIILYNNIISITRGGTGAKHAIYLGGVLPVDMNNNNYYVNASGTSNHIGFYTSNRTTLANWQAATAMESASSVSNPSFIDPSTENYAPGNAALDNKGIYVYVDNDINNAARNTTTPDIGAYEFTPPPCSIPPVTGSTSISVARICQNNPVFLTLNIGAYGSAQTFQWQTSTTANGTYTSFGNPMLTPDTTILASQTLYYRAAVSCGSTTVYTDPVLLEVDPVLPAGTYTINKTGLPTYVPGVAGGNFISFAAAKAAMSCGIGGAVVFNVDANSGPYSEKLTLDSIVGASATYTVTFKGNGNIITTNSTSNTDRAVIKLNGADHIIFDSLVIDAGTGTYGVGVQLINNADSNTFRKCTIIAPNSGSQNFAGIVINASDAGATTTGATFCDANVLDSNSIRGGYYGITLVGGTADATYIANNKITNNTVQNFYSTGLHITGTNNTTVEKNIFSRPTISTAASFVYGIYVTANPSPSLRISKNKFTSFFTGFPAATATAYAIYHNSVDVTAGRENIVSNNLIYSFGGNGPLYGFYNNGSDNVRYYYNTISFDHTTSTAAGQTVAFYQTASASGLELINNLINITRGGNGSKYAVYMATTATNLTANYNNYFVDGSGTNYFTGFYSGNRLTLADWKAASGKDANSLSIEPLFINPGAGNYRPGIISLDNKGTNTTSITTDIVDISRSATPDMGAFEFAAPICVNPPVAGTTVVTPATGACLESKISLTLSGNSPVGSLTFQWQSSANGTNWNNISGILYTPSYDTLTTTNTWYRAAVTCNGVTTYSTPLQITLGNILPAGIYSINGGNPTTYTGPNTGTNFNTFGEAVNAMVCGVGGKVVFNVAAGTYSEQIRIPYVPGTSAINTVTFQSANGNASTAILTNGNTSATANYTLKLDSTRNFIFRNLSFVSTGTTYARVVEVAATASNDSIVSCIITAPVVTASSTNVAGFYSLALKGSNIVLKNNTFNDGAYGIYFSGTGVGNNLTEGHFIDSNKINGAFNYGIYTTFQKAINVRGNTVEMTGTLSPIAYGIYASDCDSSFVMTGNKVTLSNTASTIYGINITNSDSSVTNWSQLQNNIITSSGTNTGSLYGLYITNSAGHHAINNVISLNNTGNISYGLFTSAAVANYWNNTVQLTATSLTSGYAAYIQNAATTNLSFRNNIFSNQGGGRAMFVNNSSQSGISDYNMLYTSGTTLVQRGTPAGSYPTLDAWRTASFWDLNSIVYQPAFAAGTNLQPDLANPNVWAMHGRGIQIAANNRDINNQPRPTTLTTGVPDLGAYEFFPTAQPTILTPLPATPAPNTTQVFMYGSDTVMKVTWGATAPPDVTAQRYSGVPPTGQKPSTDSMFFYTKLQSSVAGNFPYKMDLFYIDPWQGSIPDQNQIGLGRTTASNNWVVGFNSRVDTRKNMITESNLNFYDKFTGFVNPYAPPVLPDKDSSNRGRRFWVAYPVNQLNGGQEMVLYLSAQEKANVTVKINGTSYSVPYTVDANTVKVTDLIPKVGANNAFINTPGLSPRGISIESDEPIVAYAHVYGNASSGATMLMPVGVWGYEYSTLGITQDYGAGSYSYYYVISDNDGTTVEIKSAPGVAVQNPGMTPGTPYIVTLNKGEFFQVVATSQTQELSGSIIKSIPNAQGKCYPIATFSGSSRTAIDNPCSGGGDFIMQQNFPSTAWGKRYLTAPSSASTAANALQGNLYRIAVKDPTTVVKRNGTPLSPIVGNFYYQFTSSTADYIEADKPIMVAQYLSGACTGVGDPEMIYLSPIEQGIDKIGFYRNNNENIQVNYLTLIVPSGGTGLSSLSIVDGTTTVTPDFTYPHPQNALLGQNYTVVVKRWTAAQQQVRVQSDSAFTAITYGLGSVESYGYNAGTLVKNLNSLGNITNTLNSSGNATEFTCVGSPFKFTALIPLIPNTLTWKFSAVPGLSPSRDTTIVNPVPTGSVVINRTTYYMFPVNQNYTFAGPGVYGVQISYTHPTIESCDNTKNDIIYVQVLPAPKTNFTMTPSPVCEGGTVQFAGEGVTENGININNWNWTFHNNTTATTQNTTFTYPTAGTFDVKLRTVTPDGCLGDNVKQLIVNPRPTVNLVADLLTVCLGGDTALRVQNPVAGVTYNWYTTATGGTPVATNQTSLSLTNITAAASYYVEAVSTAGCSSTQRKKADINILPQLITPVVAVGTVTPNSITFTWQPVTGATYQVSTDNGTTWITPSSGAGGTSHVITGLNAFQEVKLLVRAVGAIACQTSANGTATGRTISSELFIPNTFTPNGDGRNDVLMVYGYGIREMQMMVFNQWGEKIFETRSQTTGWDGTYKSKAQPAGVYMYVSKFTLLDGTVIEKKGAINLVR